MSTPSEPVYKLDPAASAEARKLFAAAQREPDLLARAAGYDQAAARFAAAGSRANYVTSLHNAAVALNRAGRPPDARHRLDAALAMAEKIGDPRLLSMVLNTLGGVELRAGTADAAGTYARAVALAREAADPHAEALSTYNQAWSAFAAGDYDEAARRLQRLLELLGDGGAPQLEGLASMTMARLHLRRGRFDQAGPLLDWARHTFTYAGYTDFAALARFLQGSILYLEGDRPAGRAEVERSLPGISQEGNRRATVPRLCALSALAARAGDAGGAARLAVLASAWAPHATPEIAALASQLAAGQPAAEPPALAVALAELVATGEEAVPVPGPAPWLGWRYGQPPAWASPDPADVARRRLEVPPDQVVWSYFEDLSGGVDGGNYDFDARFQDLLRRRDPGLLIRTELDTEAGAFNVVARSEADLALAMTWVNVLRGELEPNPATTKLTL